MAHTTFYILGGLLVLFGLVTAATGLRRPDFPSKPTMVVITAVFALLVVATAAGAVNAARDEQGTRLEEENREASELAAEMGGALAEEKAAEGTGLAAEADPPAPAADVELGQQVFASTGCGACHTLGAAQSTGQIGPNLDEALIAQDAAYIEEAIVDPDAVIPDGFSPGSMPRTYGMQLSGEELTALVSFISESTSEN